MDVCQISINMHTECNILQPVDLAEAGTAESDSDSGMGSPMQEPVIHTNMVTEDQQGQLNKIFVFLMAEKQLFENLIHFYLLMNKQKECF